MSTTASPIPPQPISGGRLLTTRDLEALFGVSAYTIRVWVRNGKLPKPIAPTRKAQRWTAEAIQAYLNGEASK